MTLIADLAVLASNPGIALVAAALLVPLLPPAIARVYAPAAALATLLYACVLEPGAHGTLSAAGLEMQILRVDAGARLFAAVFLAVGFLGTLYAWGEDGRIGRAAGLALTGAATAAVYCGDLLTFLMLSGTATVASILLVWASGTAQALRAGMRYAVIQVAAVVLMLAGVVMYAHATGSLTFERLPAGTAGVGMILAALAIQAAFPLLHSWLKDAYPEATPGGTVLLSAFTTKLALYALIRGFAGTEVLVWVGAVMVVLPLLAAAVEDDLRRALAWALNSQLGAVVMAVGIGTEAALDGAMALAVTHTLATALQFMALGAVLTRTGTVRASELGGLRRAMPWTAGFHLVGAAALGLPLFAGFTALPLVLDAVAASGRGLAHAALLAGIAGGFLVCLARIPYRAYLGAPRAGTVEEAPVAMLLAMAGTTVLCVLPGVWPSLLHGALPQTTAPAVYAAAPVGLLVSLAAAGVVLFAALTRSRLYPADRSGTPDVDWVYRRALPVALVGLGRGIDVTWQRLTAGAMDLLVRGLLITAGTFAPSGLMGRMTRVGNGVAWVTALLLVILVIGYTAA